MAKGIEIITANRLRDGAVVYWQQGSWTEALAQAELFFDAAACKTALTAAAEDVKACKIVNPYSFAVRIEGSTAVPAKEREVIRACGPSIHPEFGKQADPGTAPHFPASAPPTPPCPKHAEGPEAFDVSV